MSAPRPLPKGLSSHSSALMGAARRLTAAEHAEAEASTHHEASSVRLLLRIRAIGENDSYELLRDTANGAERDAAEALLLVARTKPVLSALRARQPRTPPVHVHVPRCTHGFPTPCRGIRCAE